MKMATHTPPVDEVAFNPKTVKQIESVKLIGAVESKYAVKVIKPLALPRIEDNFDHNTTFIREDFDLTDLSGQEDDSYVETDLEDGDGSDSEDEEDATEDIQLKVYRKACNRFDVTAISSYSSAVEKMDLGHKGMKSPDIQALCVPLEMNAKLTTLILCNNVLGRGGVSALYKMMKENVFITNMDLSETRLDSFSIKIVAKMIKSSRSLKNVNLSGNQLQDQDATDLAWALSDNTTMTNINLSHNRFAEKAGAKFSEILEGSGSRLEDINLSWNMLRGPGVMALSNGLKSNRKLQRLLLASNGCGDMGAMAISDAWRENSSLLFLDLTDNRIGEPGALALANSIKQNNNLKKLLLAHNPLGDKGLLAILHALKEDKCLDELNVWHVPYTRSIVKEVKMLTSMSESTITAISHHQSMIVAVEKASQQLKTFEKTNNEFVTNEADRVMAAKLSNFVTAAGLAAKGAWLELELCAYLQGQPTQAEELARQIRQDGEMLQSLMSLKYHSSLADSDESSKMETEGGQIPLTIEEKPKPVAAPVFSTSGLMAQRGAVKAYAMAVQDGSVDPIKAAEEAFTKGLGLAYASAVTRYNTTISAFPKEVAKIKAETTEAYVENGGSPGVDLVSEIAEEKALLAATKAWADALKARPGSDEEFFTDIASQAYKAANGNRPNNIPYALIRSINEGKAKLQALIASELKARQECNDKAKMAETAAVKAVKDAKDQDKALGKRSDFSLVIDLTSNASTEARPADKYDVIRELMILHKLTYANLFALMDPSKLTKLSRQAFITALKSTLFPLEEKEMEDIANELDPAGGNEIKLEDFEKKLKSAYFNHPSSKN